MNPNYEIYKNVGNNKQYQVLVKVLGQGQYARTHLAKNSQTDQIIACKIISKEIIVKQLNSLSNKEQADSALKNIMYRLQNEVNNMKQMGIYTQYLAHENIIKFEGLVETKGNFYFFIEYCEGGTLEKLLQTKGKLPQNEALQYFKQLASGCKYLYDKNVIHRDLKPSNVLLTQQNCIKIADFGFSKELEEQIKDMEFFNTPWIGTPLYMSPQVIGQENYSIKTDIWSLGCIFYEMLYGQTPWYHSQLYYLQEMIRTQNLTFPQEPQVSNEIKYLISKMLIKSEAERFNVISVLETLNQL